MPLNVQSSRGRRLALAGAAAALALLSGCVVAPVDPFGNPAVVAAPAPVYAAPAYGYYGAPVYAAPRFWGPSISLGFWGRWGGGHGGHHGGWRR